MPFSEAYATQAFWNKKVNLWEAKLKPDTQESDLRHKDVRQLYWLQTAKIIFTA